MEPKIVPFPYKYLPLHNVDIMGGEAKVLKTLLFGNLIIREDNPILNYPGIVKISILGSDNKATNSVLIKGVIFDPSDNSMAIMINSSMKLLDYEAIKKEIDQNKTKNRTVGNVKKG